jgi:hypothetical protein
MMETHSAMKDEDEELIGVSLGVSEEQLRLLYGDRTSFLEQQLLRLEGVRTSALNETRITEEYRSLILKECEATKEYLIESHKKYAELHDFFKKNYQKQECSDIEKIENFLTYLKMWQQCLQYDLDSSRSDKSKTIFRLQYNFVKKLLAKSETLYLQEKKKR